MSDTQEKSILNNTVALSINISKLGVRRKVDSRKIELKEGEGEQPDKTAIAVNKELLSVPSFDAITKLDNEFRNSLYRLALPNPLFRNGTYLIPADLIDKIDKMIESYKIERSLKVSFFLDDYDDAVKSARTRLGGLFNPSDYYDKDTVKSSFRVSSQYMEIALPTQLNLFSPEIFKREKERFQQKLVSASEEITAAMRESFKELVDHMVERLKPGEDGKPRIFRDSMVNNLRDFMDSFNPRNITNDTELEKIVNQAREILNGKSAKDLRNITDVKKSVLSGMTEIKKQLSEMVTNAPIRKFKFDD